MRSGNYVSVRGDILSVRDYAEHLSAHFNLEIQSDHFENCRSLSIEGCNIELVDKNYNAKSESHSHLSDHS